MVKRLLEIAKDPFNQDEFIEEDSYSKFNFQIFTKMFLYHFGFFFIFGPPLIIFFLLFEGKTFTQNMGFYGLTRIHFKQFIHTFSFLTAIMLYNLYNDQLELGVVELFMSTITTFIFCLMVALRYATAADTRIYQQYLKIFTKEDNDHEYIDQAWSTINPQAIDDHIKEAMIRNEIENITYQTMFLSKIYDQYCEKLTQYDFYERNSYDLPQLRKMFHKATQSFHQIKQQVLKDYSIKKSLTYKKSQVIQQNQNRSLSMLKTMKIFGQGGEKMLNIVLPSSEEIFNKYSGRLFVKELFLGTQVHLFQRPKALLYILGFVHAVLPVFLQFYDDYSIQSTNKDWILKYYNWKFLLYFFCNFYINFYIYFTNTIFLDTALIDFRRRNYLMRLCEVIIEPNRLRLKQSEKIFPLINIFDKNSMLSWLDTRILTLDVGQRFYKESGTLQFMKLQSSVI
eukprot:403352620